ncbi:hypothetical protein N2152v2_001557 [Parachlorella kessleri]
MPLIAAFSARRPLHQGLLGTSHPRQASRRYLRLCVSSRKQQRAAQQQQQFQQQELGPTAEGSAEAPRKALTEADRYIVASPAPTGAAPPRATKVPFYVYGPLALLGLVGVMRVVGALLRRGQSGGGQTSVGKKEELEEKEMKQKKEEKKKNWPGVAGMMRTMKTTNYEELSEEQILAARRRRMKEIARHVDNAPLDLDQIELPDNHPFAVKKKLSPEEEAVQAKRLRARRGLSEEDIRLLEEARRQSLADE